MLSEETAEVAAAAEPYSRGNPLHRDAGRLEKAVSKIQSNASDEFHWRQIECGLEFTCKCGPAHSCLFRQAAD